MDLLESLPGIMFEITLAASDVYTGVRAFEDTVNEISKHASATAEEQRIASGNVARLMRVVLEFLAEIEERRGSGSPIPDMTVPWFKYVAKDGQ
ncbi:MAG: hypothetical protein GY846_13585 [Deltaproteobacteria bacterium]|nr:hypothetical protein [Deltaproteobacteria bacterium]